MRNQQNGQRAQSARSLKHEQQRACQTSRFTRTQHVNTNRKQKRVQTHAKADVKVKRKVQLSTSSVALKIPMRPAFCGIAKILGVSEQATCQATNRSAAIEAPRCATTRNQKTRMMPEAYRIADVGDDCSTRHPLPLNPAHITCSERATNRIS